MSTVPHMKQLKAGRKKTVSQPTQIILGTLQWSRLYAEKHRLDDVELSVNRCICAIEDALRADGGSEAVQDIVNTDLLEILRFSALLAQISDEQLPDALDALMKHQAQ